MTAYLIAFVLAFVSSIIIFLPSEAVLLMLANMGNLPPIHKFGMVLDLKPYCTNWPWLLPVVMTISSNFGSMIYFSMGKGSLKMNRKIKQKLENFNFEKFNRARDLMVFTSGVASLPPVSVTAIASGMSGMKLSRYYVIVFGAKLIRFYAVLLLGKFALDIALKWFT